MEGWLDGVSQKKVRLNLTLIKQRLPETNQDTIQDSLEIATPEGKCEITVPVYTGNLQDKKMYLWIQWGISASKRHIM